MSQLLQSATRNGTIAITDGIAAPSYADQGIPYEADGSLAIDDLGAIDHYWQGLPFTAAGRLAAAINGVVASVESGVIPITTAGFVCVGLGAIDHFSTGIPYTATDQIAVV